MRRSAVAFAAALVAVLAGCARARPVSTPPPDVTPRLESAEALVRVGCFDCLGDALGEFEAVAAERSLPADALERATRGRVAAALLLEMRVRELGMADGGYLARAHDAIGNRADLREEFALPLETAETAPWRSYQAEASGDVRQRLLAIGRNVPALLEARRLRAADAPLFAYDWVSFACQHGSRDDRRTTALTDPLFDLKDAPLIVYRLHTCTSPQPEPLARLLQDQPRYVEVNFALGQAAIGRVRLDDAERHYRRAFDWRGEWPAVTAALGSVYTAFEEFDRALEFYDRTLALAPGFPEALIGRIRALSHLERHAEAFAAIDEVLSAAVRVFPGEAFYWRAWNHARLAQLDDAWQAVERAGQLWVNNQVARLAGLIAYQRRELDVARERFVQALQLNPGDCEVLYNIATIDAEQRRWAPSAATFIDAAACLEQARTVLTREIGEIASSDSAPERKARQIVRRQDQIAAAGRMLGTSWFNIAVASFNLSRTEEARRYAERVINDDRFAERAKDLLQRLGATP